MYDFQRNVYHKKLNRMNFKVFFLIYPHAIVDPNTNTCWRNSIFPNYCIDQFNFEITYLKIIF